MSQTFMSHQFGSPSQFKKAFKLSPPYHVAITVPPVIPGTYGALNEITEEVRGIKLAYLARLPPQESFGVAEQ